MTKKPKYKQNIQLLELSFHHLGQTGIKSKLFQPAKIFFKWHLIIKIIWSSVTSIKVRKQEWMATSTLYLEMCANKVKKVLVHGVYPCTGLSIDIPKFSEWESLKIFKSYESNSNISSKYLFENICLNRWDENHVHQIALANLKSSG